jgi:glycosyltransferase involved in cell wall biosynthesis
MSSFIKKTPLVTVYMPIYNAEKFLERSIESLKTQTYRNIEIILINDGSSDSTTEILEKKFSKDKNIRIYHQKNQGLNTTNNVALKLANGKYITRLDPDDTLSSNAITELVSVLENDSEAGLVYPDYYIVDEKDNVLSRVFNEPIEDRVLMDRAPHGACTMFRTEILRQLGGYYDSFRCQDGYDIWLKFIKNHKPRNINKPLFRYTRHENNLTNNKEQILETRYGIQKKYYDENLSSSKKVLGIIPIISNPIHKSAKPFNMLNGKPLIWYTLSEVVKCQRIGKFVISTDSDEVASYARDFGIEVIIRKDNLTNMFVKMNEIIKDVFETIDQNNDFEAMCLLYINSPLRKSEYIDSAVDIFNIFGADSVLAVEEISNDIYKSSNSGIVPILKNQDKIKYEDDSLFVDTSSLYLTDLQFFNNTGEFIGGKIGKIIVPRYNGTKIESDLDLEILNAVLKNTEIIERD